MQTTQGTTQRILIAGFGGQGVLFLGKWIAYAGALRQKQVSWLPSYGPEMRGGTANCSVILSENPIGSPIVSEPDVLIAMNLPSFLAYQASVRPGGEIIYDTSLIHEQPARADVRYRALHATRLATDEGLDGLANMILLGAFLEDCLPLTQAERTQVLSQVVPVHKKHLVEANMRALALGREQVMRCGDTAAKMPRHARRAV
jgi:Pyruvate:ferredoxin oxidoreductase and related 2-oxoacid:ferredoxin oxidoreductases, gamma subunit